MVSWTAGVRVTASSDADRQISRRLVFAYKTGSLVVMGVGLAWAGIFLATGRPLLSALEFALSAIAAATWLLIHRGRLSTALTLSQAAFLAFALVFCLVFDVPSDAAPRVSHLYLLVLAALGYINYLHRRSRLQLGLVVASLMAFIALASAPLAVPFAQPLADEIRYVGAWANAIVATVMLAGCAHIMQLEMERTSRLVRDLQGALWKGELAVHYQRQVDRRGRPIGAEALLRWNNPRRGMVSPATFIPAAEKADLMIQIGGWVLNEACRTLASWKSDPATRDMTIAVNVTASQVHDDGFVPTVEAAIAIHEIDPSRLKLELTESVMIANMDSAVGKMNALRALGVSISLDDFGTGYSSLGYLQSMPLDQIKMDRSFVADVVGNPRSAALARNIIKLGRDLDLVVLAEGIETQEQYRLLLDAGCDQFQGYLFGRPEPVSELEQSLAQLPEAPVILRHARR